jgi:hypothetical protein
MSFRNPREQPPRWCIGSGVPGDVWEHGHSIVAGTEADMFRTHDRHGTSNYRSRCRRCESSRYHMGREDCRGKAAATFRKHAGDYVDAGFAADIEEAKAAMINNGVSPSFIAALLSDAIGKQCPGMCCDATFGPDGRIVVVRWEITFDNLEFDWRDPRYPITPENVGALDKSCNRQKGRTPWPVFISRQRAILTNLRHATLEPPPPAQLELPWELAA